MTISERVDRVDNPDKNSLQVQRIELAYDDYVVLADFSLDLHRGSLIGLIGPNGAGKTTLMLALSGQFRPRKGTILFNGMDIYRHNREFKHRIGYVHEAPFFYAHLTAAEFLHFIAQVKRVPAGERTLRIDEILAQVCLTEDQDKLTGELSLGMKKKLAIAAALLGNPSLLVLDEALNGIDVESAYRIKEVLRKFVAGGGTVLLSTHVLEVIEKLCDRYLVLKAGRLLADVQAAEWKAARTDSDEGLEEYIIHLLHQDE
jgi:ABC-2 type transport system ATP-binding protein